MEKTRLLSQIKLDLRSKGINQNTINQIMEVLKGNNIGQLSLQLHDANKRNLLLFNSMPTGAGFINHISGKIVDINPAFLSGFGVRKKDIVDKDFEDFFPNKQQYNELKSKMQHSTIISDFEIDFKPKNGETKCVLVSMKFIDKTKSQRFFTVTDITCRKKLEKKMKSQYELLNTMMNTVSASIFVKDANGRYLLINDYYAQILGKQKQEIIGKTGYDLFPYEIAQKYEQTDEQLMQDQVDMSYVEREIFDKNGDRKTLLTSKSLVMDENGNVHYIVGVGMDITRQKEVEERLRNTKNKQRMILENMDVAAGFMDIEGNLEEVSDAIYKLLEVDNKDKKIVQSYLFRNRRFKDYFKQLIEKKYVSYQEQMIKTMKGNKKHIMFSAEYDENTQKLVFTVTDITLLKKAQQFEKYLAYHDKRTGLKNREFFKNALDHELDRIERTKQNVALMYLDLDDFKEVNDTYGHETGDKLLKQVGERLKSAVRKSDVVARIGGDEFGIMLLDIKDKKDLSKIARHIIESLKQPFLIDKKMCRIGVSIGISLAPENGMDGDGLMNCADTAMYTVKHFIGKNNYLYFKDTEKSFYERGTNGQKRLKLPI